MLRVLWLIHLMAGIHGTVRSSERGLPVRGAMVQLDGIQVGVTDSLGRYRLTGLTAGAHEFRIVSAGFESQRVGVSLVDGADLALDVSLAAHPVLLPPIETVANRTVVADSTTSAPVNEPGLARFAGGWQRDRPAAATDVNALLASAPGVSTRGDNLGALSIRGGRGSENRMLLDGIPLSSATHFAGASGGLNPDAIGSVDLHGGVASARFDGALAGVVELHTTDGTPAPRITANASVSDLRSLAQLPVGRGSLLLGGRTSFRNLLTDGSGLGTTNGYQDAIAVGRIPLGPGELRLVSFESGNRMHWESSADGLEAGHDDASAPPSGPFGNAAIWRSGAVGATWAGSAHAGGAWRLAGWWNGSSAAIQTASVAGALALTSGISELGLAAEYQRRLDKGTLLLGAEVTRPRSWYRSSSSSANAADAAAGLIITGRPTLGALFGEWGWRASHALDLRLGLRASSNFASQTTLAPRAVLSFHPDGRTSIDAGFGRTHQAVQSLLNEENITSTIVSPMLPAATALNTPMAHADQYALTIARRIGPRTMLSLEGYQRNWHGVVTPAATAAGFFSTTAPAVGDGESRGVNLSFDAAHGPLFVGATAGLASARQEIADGSYHIGSERPWLFSGTAGWIPSARTAIQFAWFSGGGQPTTAMLPGLEWHPFSGATGVGEMEGVASNQAGAINGLRLPARLRLDAGIRHLWTRGPGSTRGITTSLRLENLLNRDEPAGVVALANGSLQLLRGTPRGVVFELGWAY